MRQCKGKYLKDGQFYEFDLGYFHQWGSDYEEFETGPGNFTTAIIELPDGKVVIARASDIQFLTKDL